MEHVKQMHDKVYAQARARHAQASAGHACTEGTRKHTTRAHRQQYSAKTNRLANVQIAYAGGKQD